MVSFSGSVHECTGPSYSGHPVAIKYKHFVHISPIDPDSITQYSSKEMICEPLLELAFAVLSHCIWIDPKRNPLKQKQIVGSQFEFGH